TIDLPGELRGIVLTPNGNQLFVANYSRGIIHRIDTRNDVVIEDIPVGSHPFALAVTNDGDGDDFNETVFVSEFFSELVPGGPGEGFDTGRQGVLFSFAVAGGDAQKHTLAPLANSGFVADRTAFAGTVFAAPPGVNPMQTPQGCFPNQLNSVLV